MIKNRRLKADEVMVEQRLADERGASRIPLRQARRHLEGEGLVVWTANRCFAVCHVGLKEYLQSLTFRGILELETIVLAAGHMEAEGAGCDPQQIGDCRTHHASRVTRD